MMETRLIYWFIGYLMLSTFIAGCGIDHEVDEHDDVALKLKHELLRFSERFGERFYYGHGGKKVYFHTDLSLVLLEIDGMGLEQATNILPSDQIIAVRLEDDNTLQLIVSFENAVQIFRRHQSFIDAITVYPAIKTLPDMAIAFITDRISVRFPEDTSATRINQLAQKYNLKLIKKTLYGSYIFAVRDNIRTLETANAIQENESMLSCGPDFVMLISTS